MVRAVGVSREEPVGVVTVGQPEGCGGVLRYSIGSPSARAHRLDGGKRVAQGHSTWPGTAHRGVGVFGVWPAMSEGRSGATGQVEWLQR